MILHLVTKHFVSNAGLSVFEKRAPGQNIVLVLHSMPNSVATVNKGIEITADNEKEIVNSLDFSKVTHVVIHYLTSKTACFVQKYVPKGIPIYWWTYGGDLYQPYLERRGYNIFYTDLTPFKYGYTWMVQRYIKTHLNRLLFKLGVFYHNRYMQCEFLDRIYGIIPCIPPEHEIACAYLKKDLKLLRFVVQSEYPHFDETFYDGNKIVIGHSASATDNHLYALKYLSKIDIRDSFLSLTLSYNINSYKYLDIVKKRYKRHYKEKVFFVENFLSKKEYNESVKKIKMMILPTWRQEALANILLCFLNGIPLFLSKRSPMYKYYKDCDFILFAIEDIDQRIFDTLLTYEEKQHNRILVLKRKNEILKYVDEDFKLYFGDVITDN